MQHPLDVFNQDKDEFYLKTQTNKHFIKRLNKINSKKQKVQFILNYMRIINTLEKNGKLAFKISYLEIDFKQGMKKVNSNFITVEKINLYNNQILTLNFSNTNFKI
jgi:hypothetical protein